ncbi:MAG: 3'-5' exonuclease [Gemmatimonadaceae bacterium]|nr:3'-5' exonuclease [Gemmatimonadaceae bacterium]
MTYGGIRSRPEPTLLTDRAAKYLEKGPADVVDLIGHICNLPAAPRIVAEHMAQAMFAGRPEFVCDPLGRWTLTTLRLPAQPLAGLSYAVVDVETTGGRPPADRITEIAAVIVRDGEVKEMFETLVNPERSIPRFITQLTNISWEMVKDAPTFSVIAPEVMQALAGNVFVAHNAAFDWKFVSHEINRASGTQLFGRRLCTVRLARRLLPHLPRRSLDYVANYYGVEIAGRHRAAGDALATAHCLIRLLDDAAQRGCTTWEDLDLLLGARSPRAKKKRRSAFPSPVNRDTTA